MRRKCTPSPLPTHSLFRSLRSVHHSFAARPPTSRSRISRTHSISPFLRGVRIRRNGLAVILSSSHMVSHDGKKGTRFLESAVFFLLSERPPAFACLGITCYPYQCASGANRGLTFGSHFFILQVAQTCEAVSETRENQQRAVDVSIHASFHAIRRI